MKQLPNLSGLDLAALLSSRVCHDVISPVGAIANGLELLDEDNDAETSEIAMQLIRSSAENAKAKLQFARIAFGAAGSAGSQIDTGDAQSVAQAFFDIDKKTELKWQGERALVAKNKVKLLLNLLLIGISAIPRGGVVSVEIHDPNGELSYKVTSSGKNARVPPEFLAMMSGSYDEQVDAHAVQPLYALMLAQSCNMEISANLKGEDVVFEAR